MPKTLRILLLTLFAALILFTLNSQTKATIPSPDSSLTFIENKGQFDPRARFLMQGNGLTGWITDDGLWLTYSERVPRRARQRHPTPQG
ncbi:MAG: hypothetical protein HC806_02365 [Anaerolineae bacterium]|nr:hypothetical protein [Anaerolineae bacterium]